MEDVNFNLEATNKTSRHPTRKQVQPAPTSKAESKIMTLWVRLGRSLPGAGCTLFSIGKVGEH